MNCHGLFIPLGRRWSCEPSLETGRCPILKVKGNSAISRMKVAFLCPSLSRTSFGIFETQRRLAQCLQELHDTEVEVFGPADEHTDRDRHQWFPIEPRCFKAFGPSSFRYSPGLQRHFLRSGGDIAHLHALWMYQSIVMARWSRKFGKPYVISANGMLDPWAIRNSFWKKRFALLLYERRCLERAACIHVSSRAEADSVRHFGFQGSICVIPNGVDCPRLPARRGKGFPGNVGSLMVARFFFFLDGSIRKKGWKRSSKAGVPPALRKRGTGTLPLSAPVGGNTRRNSSD